MHRVLSLMLIGVLLAQPFRGSAETDIPGWGKARWGMTYSAVKKQFDLFPWEPGNTPTCKSKKKIRIWGRDFTVAFYFDERSPSGKLFKVVLVHFDGQKWDTHWIDAIKDLLVEKYGNPESFEVRDKMKISHWKKSEGQLILTTLNGQTVMCALEYSAVRMEGKKL